MRTICAGSIKIVTNIQQLQLHAMPREQFRGRRTRGHRRGHGRGRGGHPRQLVRDIAVRAFVYYIRIHL